MRPAPPLNLVEPGVAQLYVRQKKYERAFSAEAG